MNYVELGRLSRSRHVVPWLFTGVLLACLAPAAVQARDELIVASGNNAPNAAGNTDGRFQSFSKPVLNESGQVAFGAGLTGTSGGATTDVGIYRGSIDNPAVQIIRANDVISGGTRMSDQFASDALVINDPGHVGFRTSLRGSVAGFDTGIFLGSGGPSVTRIVREGDAAPGTGAGVFGDFFSSTFQNPRLNNFGQVAFFEDGISGAQGDRNAGIFSGSGGSLTVLAREANDITDTRGFIERITQMSNQEFAFNDAGQAAFVPSNVQSAGANSQSRLIRSAGSQRGEVLMFGGGANPTLQPDNFVIRNFASNPVGINGSGLVTSVARGNADISINVNRLFATDHRINTLLEDTTPLTYALDFQQLPGSAAKIDLLPFQTQDLVVNGAGQAVFEAGLFATTDVGRDDVALLRADSGANLTVLARTGQTVPGGDGVFNSFDNGVSANIHGAALFDATLRDNSAGANNDRGLYFSDGVEQIEVVREGKRINGQTVASFTAALGSGGEDGRGTGLNDSGQVAYGVTFDNGAQSVFLFTPELRWRSDVSDDWDSNSNWTLGLDPGRVHDVAIASPRSLTVRGPSSETAVKSLTVGGGAGVATLSLGSGAVRSLQQTTILPGGVLTGDGTIAGNIDNRGTVLADNVRVDGTLTNRGLITGDGRISGQVVNSSTGTVEAIGQDIEFTNGLTNAQGGVIAGRNAIFRFQETGLTNDGTFALSFGTSDVFGNVDNRSAGRVVVSGQSEASFWNNVVNNGEFRVRDGSTTVFFGDVSGSGNFSGGGTTFFEGSLSPGNSPGLLTIEGDASLGDDASVVIELAGTSSGTYDQLRVEGKATLAGSLVIQPIGAYDGPSGAGQRDVFSIMAATSREGTFSEVVYDGQTLEPHYVDGTSYRSHAGGGLFRSLIYDEGAVQLVNFRASSGDANGDGLFSSTDLVQVFQYGEYEDGVSGNSGWMEGDWNHDGDFGTSDLVAAFQTGLYERPWTAIATPKVVPEPSSVILLIVGLMLAGQLARQRCR